MIVAMLPDQMICPQVLKAKTVGKPEQIGTLSWNRTPAYEAAAAKMLLKDADFAVTSWKAPGGGIYPGYAELYCLKRMGRIVNYTLDYIPRPLTGSFGFKEIWRSCGRFAAAYTQRTAIGERAWAEIVLAAYQFARTGLPAALESR